MKKIYYVSTRDVADGIVNEATVKENGLCCDACNFGVVIPIRLARLAKRETEEAQNAGSKV